MYLSIEEQAVIFMRLKYGYIGKLRAQRILFIADLLFYKEHGFRMFDKPFELWQYGCVIPVVFYDYDFIVNKAHETVLKLDLNKKCQEAIDKAVALTNGMTVKELSKAATNSRIYKQPLFRGKKVRDTDYMYLEVQEFLK